MFNSTRLVFARSRRGWTKKRLAEGLDCTPRSIQGYESGEFSPDNDRLEQIAKLLEFPVNFFHGADLPLISEHSASFRSMSKMSASLRNRALGAGTIAFLFNDWMEERFNLPEANLPDLSDLSPEAAAATLRRMWGLGEAPIGNLVHLLELKGLRVYSLAIEAKEVDAFSVWQKNRPFVFLNTMKSAEHSRFDAAHELGHLVRDRHSMLHAKAHSPEMEHEANAFASAFLMPPNNIIAHKPAYPTIINLIELKKLWGVSLSALAYRMNNLGILTEWTYRNICIQIAKNGFRVKEPSPMKAESSQVLGKVFDALRKEGVTKNDIAGDLLINSEEIDSLTFGLTLSLVPSISSRISEGINSNKNTPSLRIVK